MALFLSSHTNKASPFPIFSVLLFSSLLFSSSLVLASVNTSKALSIQQQCIEDHFSALLLLKQGFYFSDYTTLFSWNPGNRDCCSWEGITCDGATGQVIGLDLSELSILGKIDSVSLFRLQSLQRLNLAFNYFDGSPIPSGFDQLTSLTHLNLSGLNFYGQIPLEISRLTTLVSLDLSYNGFYSDSYWDSLKLENPNIGALVQNLSGLRELHLDFVYIPAQGSEWGLALSSSLPHLRKLSLRRCDLSGPIHSSLSKLHFLSELDLSRNNLSSVVPNFIGNLSSLTLLQITGCGLYGNFPESIFRFPNLQTLDVRYNPLLTGEIPPNSTLRQLYLSETGFCSKLQDSLGNFSMLTTLVLSYCNLSGPLPSWLVKLDKLVFLDLSSSGFSGPIPSSFGTELPNLQVLRFHNNSLSGTIPSSLFSLPSLQTLHLAFNQFSGKLGEFHNASSLRRIRLEDNKLQGPIPTSVFELTKLEILTLSSNNFSGDIDLGLLQNLMNLWYLDLSYNNFSVYDGGSNSTSLSFPQFDSLFLTSCNIRKFPDLLRNQGMMYFLDLSDNRINGEIPSWIWMVAKSYLNLSHNALEGLEQSFPLLSVSSLQYLDLSFNKLKGSIPIPPRPSIFFSLSNNRFSGEVPSLICNRTSLQVLDMSYNHLNGSIPPCLGEISDSLIVLNLGGNAFHNTLLQTFKERCTLETLDLNGNQLEGQVPSSLANCKKLEVLNLGNNQIYDTFPFWFENLSQLRVLVLTSNKFHGTIGHPLANHSFPLLQIFDLSSNNFTGSLPSNMFSNWKAMMEAKSQSQFLSKEFGNGYYQEKVSIVSKGLEMELVTFLTAFTVVDLSNNQFFGDIPESIGNLKLLIVLNMSYNDLTGRIPASLGNIKALESLDLSYNNVLGEIPSQLTKLMFLAVLDLSHNLLVGSIPQGNQFNTFTNKSFIGNSGLCGPPLSKKCKQFEPSLSFTQSKNKYDWKSMCIGLGVGYGVGMRILF